MNNCIYHQRKDIIFRREDDEAILFNPDTSGIVVINPTGCFIWPLFDGKHTKEDIVTEMLNEFDVRAEILEKDLKNFVNELERQGFIEKV